MLPIITIENVNSTIETALADLQQWRKTMIHHLKDENPELNTAIIEISQKTGLDPKAVAAGAYIAYALLEKEAQADDNLLGSVEE